VVLFETGKPPPVDLSQQAHAGCLSFELSSRRARIIVNCGVSNTERGAWRSVARSTPAHSTATLGDVSSARFLPATRYGGWLGSPILAGPTQVPVQREESEAGQRVVASHNGYQDTHQVVHERDLTLSSDGSVLDGIDRFLPTGKTLRNEVFAIRFHLHPAIKASPVRSGTAVLLVAPDGEAWEFVAPGCETTIEESIYLSDTFGHRRSEQIVIHGRLAHRREAAWQLRRTASGKTSRRRVSDGPAGDDPDL
jgi:uncharacterized heparinase superfamily protein